MTRPPCSYSLEARLFLNFRNRIPKKMPRTQTRIPLAIPMTRLLEMEGSGTAKASYNLLIQPRADLPTTVQISLAPCTKDVLCPYPRRQ